MVVLILGLIIFAALGASLRFFVSEVTVFPYGTLVLNITGCYLIGVLFMLKSHGEIKPMFWFFLAVGFLGALTTFSGFALDFMRLFEGKKYILASAYFLAMNGLGLVAVFLGHKSSFIRSFWMG